MFAPDIITLRQFYTTPLGESVRSLVMRGIRNMWPDAAGDTLLGIGYPTPYLEDHINAGASAIVCMPASQGAVFWPPSRKNLTFLSFESQLPLPKDSVNRVILVHSLEHSEQLPGMMREIWRVLTPGGRVLAVTPNRVSFWARSSRSPFGYGRPFTSPQLKALLSEYQFTPTRASTVLFTPPVYSNWLWRVAGKVEIIGKLLFRPVGGVLLVEAEKQLYAAIKQPVVARQAYRVPATNPAKA